jgi:nitrite reductase/ring-hydroxylating ferredoxin subunit
MASAAAIPGARFTGADFLALERQLLWPRGWVFVGRDDEVSEPGHYFMWERTGVPLIVIRSADGAVRIFYNSCRHRGAPVVREPRGRNRALRCQYHSWTYDTFGRLVSVPDERDFVDLRLEDRSLVEVRAESCGGWLFATENPTAPPLANALGAAADGLKVAAGHRAIHSKSWRVKANWKLAAAILPGVVAGMNAGEAATLAPNLAWATGPEASLVMAAWPVIWPELHIDHCEITATFAAPAWDEDDGSPAASAAWQARIAKLDEAGARLQTEAEALQESVRRTGGLPGAESAIRLNATVDAAIGHDAIPAALRTAVPAATA